SRCRQVCDRRAGPELVAKRSGYDPNVDYRSGQIDEYVRRGEEQTIPSIHGRGDVWVLRLECSGVPRFDGTHAVSAGGQGVSPALLGRDGSRRSIPWGSLHHIRTLRTSRKSKGTASDSDP